MTRSGCFLVTLVTLLAYGCGGEPAASEAEFANAPMDSITVRQLRVDLAGTDGAVRIVRARLVDIPANALPMPSLGGAAILVGYSGAGMPSTAMPFSLPSVIRVEGSHDGAEPGRELSLSESSLSLFLDASAGITHLEILNEAGTLLATLPDTEFEVPEPTRPKQMVPLEPREELARDFPHIEFMGPDGDLGIVYENPRSSFMNTVEIGMREAQDIRDALDRMPRAALGAVRTVAVARFENDAVVTGATFGSTVVLNFINADLGAETSRIMVHEATHAYEYLADGGLRLALFNRTEWPQAVKDAAHQTLRTFNLQAGLGSAWNDLQQAAVDAGIGGEYLGDAWSNLGVVTAGDIAAAPLGFASAYGARDASEDLAEYVGWLVVPEAPDPSQVCDLVKDAGSPFPVARALPYIKAKFLEGLELLTPSQVTACVGEPEIAGPPGIHLGSRSLTEGIRGGFIDVEGERFLGVLASDGPYQMLIRVQASEEQPRGLYRLDDIGYFGVERPTNGVLLGHDTNSFQARTSASGLVLVSEYGPKKIAGAVFGLRLRDLAANITNSYPLGTFRVDNP